jgi:hypothetical protein
VHRRWTGPRILSSADHTDHGEDLILKDNLAPGSISIVTPTTLAKALTEDELQSIVERLNATRHIFRQNQDMREEVSRRDAEVRALQSRNAELEEIMRKFAPMLLNVATSMGMAVKNDKLDGKG